MKRILLIMFTLMMVLGLTLPANALLIDNADGTVSSDISTQMWLQDAGLAGTGVSWADAFDLAADVNADATLNAGYTDWRLPEGSTCNSRPSGANCFGSELFDMYWELLISNSTLLAYLDSPFTNGGGTYWTSTEWTDTAYAMSVDMVDGGQNDYAKTTTFSVVLVRDPNGGDTCPAGTTGTPPTCDDGTHQVPEPGTMLLLGTGLIGLAYSRRKLKK